MCRITVAILLLLCPMTAGSVETGPFSARHKMVKEQLVGRGINDKRLLAVMSAVDREVFIQEKARDLAYEDVCLPAAGGRMILSPYLTAYRFQALHLSGKEKVLEIGVWPCYETVLLAELCKEVYAVERDVVFGMKADERLKAFDYRNVKLIVGEAEDKWQKYAPFDVIVINEYITYAPHQLIEKLKDGGKMLISVSEKDPEKYILIRKHAGEVKGKYETEAEFLYPSQWQKNQTAKDKADSSVSVNKSVSKEWVTPEGSRWKKKKRPSQVITK